MNLGSILKALPSLLGLVASLFGRKDDPPKRAEDILGEADEPTKAQKAKEEADRKAREKYNR